jgi:hypothetical protein
LTPGSGSGKGFFRVSDTGSWIQDLLSRIFNAGCQIQDLGSRISDHRSQTNIYESVVTIFSKKYFNSLSIASIFSVPVQKPNNFQFWEIYDCRKNDKTNNFYFPSFLLLLLLLDLGSEFQDLGKGMGKNQDLGSEIKNPGSATLLLTEQV